MNLSSLQEALSGLAGQSSPVISALSVICCILLPILSVLLVVRCAVSLLRGKIERETWGRLTLPDGDYGEFHHWENTVGRSRRSAFVAGILGVILADAAVGVVNWRSGVNQTVHLGSAGALDAVVLSGVTAVLLCELFGELMERIARGRVQTATEGGQGA